MKNNTDEIASKYLGKKTESAQTYCPDFLVAVPRQENRTQYGINCDNLPFEGIDVWHAYEFSALTENGLPITRLLKMKYGCDSRFIIESKSLKLYLNSFNMTRIGKTPEECLRRCKITIEADLKEKLKTPIEVNFIDNNAARVEIFENFRNISDFTNENDLIIDKFKEAPELLETEEAKSLTSHFLKFDSLRSNCRVTHQPDFGDVFIYYKSKRQIKPDSLVKYLCSFRSEFHFHEECCEMIFKRLFDLLDQNDELFVCTLYTRRGGIDICPVRWSKNCSFKGFEPLIDTTNYARCGIKQ